MSMTMSTRMMRLVRNSSEVGVFLAGIVVGLCGAMLSAAAVTYLQHGPYSAWGSGAAVTFWVFAFPFALIGLIAGAMLGYGAAMQLWPPDNERRY
jgi:hypothetical protein